MNLTFRNTLLHDLATREVIADVSEPLKLDQHLSSESRTVYAGFDPSAQSLHVGHLVLLAKLRRFQEAGHQPIALIGGATGLIGDPSGKSDERRLNSAEVVADWVDSLTHQVAQLLDPEGRTGLRIVNNLDWTNNLDVITYLRDFGKHFSINAMMQRDSVKTRLERDGSGISYTEFSYMLLQSIDFVELATRFNCSLQIGGSDQWGNIVSGMDLVRRNLQRQVFGLTFNLLTKNDGTKFGKTAGETVWLNPTMTSPYAFYQYWLNVADAEVESLHAMFSFRSKEERAELVASTLEQPELRRAQRTLAQELTEWVHGSEGLKSAERITQALFGGTIADLREGDLQQLTLDGLPHAESFPSTSIIDGLCSIGLAASRSAARRLIMSNSVTVNLNQVLTPDADFETQSALFGKYFLVRRGKKTWGIVHYP